MRTALLTVAALFAALLAGCGSDLPTEIRRFTYGNGDEGITLLGSRCKYGDIKGCDTGDTAAYAKEYCATLGKDFELDRVVHGGTGTSHCTIIPCSVTETSSYYIYRCVVPAVSDQTGR